jgi:hypothetical protein
MPTAAHEGGKTAEEQARGGSSWHVKVDVRSGNSVQRGRAAEGGTVTDREVLKLQKSRLSEDHSDTLASKRLLAYLSQGTDETLSTLEASHRPRHSGLKFLQRLRSRKLNSLRQVRS